MADDFDVFLRDALAPPARGPDRRFVARVQTTIVLEERMHAERRALLRQLGMQMLAVATIAAGLLWLGRAPAVAGFFERRPEIALSALLAGFTLMVVLVGSQAGGRRIAG
jgi:hypothetical protein